MRETTVKKEYTNRYIGISMPIKQYTSRYIGISIYTFIYTLEVKHTYVW